MGLPRRSPTPIADRPDPADEPAAAPASRYEQAGLDATARIDLSASTAGGWPTRAGGPEVDEDDFIPANETERDLYQATIDHSTDSFLSTLLLATVLVPVGPQSRPGSSPGESGFAFRTEEVDGERYLVVFTSRDRLGEHYLEPARTVAVRFVDLIRNWPDPAWSFAVNPGSAVGARYPGPQVIALANWAIEAGLGGDPVEVQADSPKALPQRAHETDVRPTMMQKTVPVEQIDFYLERGYDRVAGFVHRAAEVEHLRVPGELYAALGLLYDGSPYQGDAKEAYVLRWPAYRPSLYRIPYGGQSEQALRAMDGWVIERPPFRGNGFAPGEGKDVIAEFKVDSVRLPHGAQLWRLDGSGAERIVAVFDADAPMWRKVGEADA
ncbi:SseB family protein [Nucisporomicrobium flavum]